jgi:prophage regulatory protein
MQPISILRIREVLRRTGGSKSALYAAIARGEFPRPIKLWGARAVGWLEHEIEHAIRQRISATRQDTAAA